MPEPDSIAAALKLAERVWGDLPPPEAAQLPTTTVVIENGERRVRDLGRGWFVVETKHRAEEDAATALRDLGCDVFLPVMRKDIVHRKSRKVVTRSFILFTRYLFAELPLDPQAWRFVRGLDPIESVLGAGGETQFPADEVARFRRAAEQGLFDETIEARVRRGEIPDPKTATAVNLFPKGSRVRVTAGPLFGYYGQVVNPRGRAAVRAMLENVRNATPVTLPIDMIELL